MAWTVCVNAPGYLPDNAPITYPTWAEAREAMVGELDDTLDCMGERAGDMQSLALMADAVEGQPWTLQVGGLSHTITAGNGMSHDRWAAGRREGRNPYKLPAGVA